ncbi:MAG TPA: LysR substrate-binding domain-containing protein, partial [Acidimicrobiales bacterium]|nr:LysR substrate-binding domain-containing protein [Acidimicrobiales bacterium]
ASQNIHVSQSALSRRLQQLEAELGAPLIVRGRHGVALTDVGRMTVEQGRHIVERYEQLRRNIVETLGLQRGELRVGGGATVTSFLLPGAIAEFQSEHPGIVFHVKEAGSNEIAVDVGGGRLDMGIVTMPVSTRDVDITGLLTDEIVLVARSDHRLSAQRVSVRDLNGETVVGFEQGTAIRHIIDGALLAAGAQVEVVMELRSIPSILKMVATTGSLAFVSRLSLQTEPGITPIPVRGLSIVRSLGLATRLGFPLSTAAEAFAGLLSRVCSEMRA